MIRRGTYSIVARDPQTGELGVAVQSHWFGVGPIVAWARPGVGAVATQSIAEPAFGPRILDLIAAGSAPGAALAAVLGADPQAAYRQVAVVDASGTVAAHTGGGCIAFAGDEHGDGFSVQANMMASPEVWPAMARAFTESSGSLARRLATTLDAAEAAGGDARGRQSCALLIVPAEGERWQTVVDLRVDDGPEPLVELHRLLDLHDAYALANEGDGLTGEGRHAEASDRYTRAAAIVPDNHELLFWAGLAAAQGGDLETGLVRVRRAIELQPGWAALLDRLEPEIAPAAAIVRERLEAAD